MCLCVCDNHYISFYVYLIAWTLICDHWFDAVFTQQSSGRFFLHNAMMMIDLALKIFIPLSISRWKFYSSLKIIQLVNKLLF